jgi:hypothetical protein
MHLLKKNHIHIRHTLDIVLQQHFYLWSDYAMFYLLYISLSKNVKSMKNNSNSNPEHETETKCFNMNSHPSPKKKIIKSDTSCKLMLFSYFLKVLFLSVIVVTRSHICISSISDVIRDCSLFSVYSFYI